ncbi:hypothetical protein VT03_22525 [Planctomyces sp. SH-PL14]|nr:hypothetical protein VT03_22525 [Planctomyces sp. SH-PL14]
MSRRRRFMKNRGKRRTSALWGWPPAAFSFRPVGRDARPPQGGPSRCGRVFRPCRDCAVGAWTEPPLERVGYSRPSLRDFLAGKTGVEARNAVGVHASACPAGRDLFEDRPCWAPTGLQHPSLLALHPRGLVGGAYGTWTALGHGLLQTSLDERASGGQGAFCPLHPLTRVPLDPALGPPPDSRQQNAIHSLPRPSAFSLPPPPPRIA